ncbi:restriction endonuclease [Micromonospora sp. M12]
MGLVVSKQRARERFDQAQRDRLIAVTDGMSGAEFEQWFARLLVASGFRNVTVCGGAGDRGADVMAIAPDGRRVVVQCKRQSIKNRVGSAAIQRFAGTCRDIHGGEICVLVTNSFFTAGDGIQMARQLDITLVDRLALRGGRGRGCPHRRLSREPARTECGAGLAPYRQPRQHGLNITGRSGSGRCPQVPSLSTAAHTRVAVDGRVGLVDARLQSLLDRRGRAGHTARRALPGTVVDTPGRVPPGRLVRILPGSTSMPRSSGIPVLTCRFSHGSRRNWLVESRWRTRADAGAQSTDRAGGVGLRRQPPGEPVHLDVSIGSGLRGRPHLLVRHRPGFAVEPPHAVLRGGHPVTRLDRTLVDSWPLLPTVARPGMLIRAVNDRLTTPQRLVAALAEVPRLTDRTAVRGLLDRLAAGCRSPLEVWGHDHVFTGPGMPTLTRQARVRVGPRTIYLDMFAEAERVNIELDGATSHGDAAEREIDLRRDSCSPPSASSSSVSVTAVSPPTRSAYARKPSPSSPTAAFHDHLMLSSCPQPQQLLTIK